MKDDYFTDGRWSDDVSDSNGKAGECDDETDPSDELSNDGEVKKMQQPQPTYKPIHQQHCHPLSSLLSSSSSSP